MDKFYTKEHEWITIDGNTGTIGITAYAANQLGDITYIELPKIGKTVNKGAGICTVESVKAASEIYSPISGKVTEVNKKLDNEPQIINSSPESDGWMVKMELSNPSEKESLLRKQQYDEFIKGL
jgi:glycine cleavage system H protein